MKMCDNIDKYRPTLITFTVAVTEMNADNLLGSFICLISVATLHYKIAYSTVLFYSKFIQSVCEILNKM